MQIGILVIYICIFKIRFVSVDKICSKLTAPEYGSIKLSGRKPGSKATYTCNVGFTLEGEDTRKCQRNGVWSGEAPTCESM